MANENFGGAVFIDELVSDHKKGFPVSRKETLSHTSVSLGHVPVAAVWLTEESGNLVSHLQLLFRSLQYI